MTADDADDYRVPEWTRRVVPGTLDRRVLLQDHVWVTVQADVLFLEHVSEEHLVNIRAMLQARAGELHLAAMLDAFEDEIEALLAGTLTGEALGQALTGASIATLSARGWLATLPLLRAIDRRLHRHPLHDN